MGSGVAEVTDDTDRTGETVGSFYDISVDLPVTGDLNIMFDTSHSDTGDTTTNSVSIARVRVDLQY